MEVEYKHNNLSTIRVAGIIPECVVNAPGGISYVIFAQGCKHHCPGCHNPGTHDFNGGVIWSVSQLEEDIENYPLSNSVTFTGGDPFYQPEGFMELATRLTDKGYQLVAYSGFYLEDLITSQKRKKLLDQINILIDGPFIQDQHDRSLNFRGSQNQRILDVQASLQQEHLVYLEKFYEKGRF